MELRSAEKDVAEIRRYYLDLRRQRPELALPALADAQEELTTSEAMATTSAVESLQLFEIIRTRLNGLHDKMAKFRKRTTEKDPVTDKLRYGEKTLVRVETLLATYEELQKALAMASGESPAEGDVVVESSESVAVHKLRQEANREEQETARKRLEEEERVEHENAAKREEERRLAEEKKRVEEAVLLDEQRRRDELARQAEVARLAQQRAQQEERRADREWMAGITKGPDGVREQLRILVESTKEDDAARVTAISALHTIFSQIVARPEEPNFRRIRRDHPRFNEDVGRHPGGKELLIAAGFALGAIDDVPSFLSREPDLENDMDGWSTWFDLIKKTLEIIEEEMVK